MRRARFADLPLIGIFALLQGAGYWLAARYCYFATGNVLAVAFASSVMLSLLLLMPRRWWPAVLAALTAIQLSVAWGLLGRPLGRAAAATVFDVAEALLAALAVQRLIAPRLDFTRLPHTLRFLVLAGVVAIGSALCRAAFCAIMSHDPLLSAWMRWSLAEFAGFLFTTPIVLGWGVLRWAAIRRAAPRTRAEGAVILALSGLLAHVTFGCMASQSPWVYQLGFALFLVWVWGALRFHPRLVATAIGSTAAILLYDAAQGRGPLGTADQPLAGIILGVQILLVLMGVASLLISSLMAERRRDHAALQRSHAEMEHRVAERTTALRATIADLHTEMQQRRAVELALQREHQILERLFRASDHERRLIAYEIHDGLAQQLAGAIMYLQTYAHQRTAKGNGAEQALQHAMALVQQSHAESRRLISGVRPPILDELGVVAAIEHLIQNTAVDAEPCVELRINVQFERLLPVVEDVIYRIVQEALTNARKHSRSGKIRVEFTQQGEHLRIAIRDWGVGFDPQAIPENRFGLQGIRERVRLLDGQCAIDSQPGAGTSIVIDLSIVPRDDP